jgi:hypothetical protein
MSRKDGNRSEEPTLEEMTNVAACPEIPKEETRVETAGTWKAQCEDQQWNVRSWSALKMRTTDNIVQGNLKG